MIISESHQFIFVHNPKVAGTSIKEIFRPFAWQNRSHVKYFFGTNRLGTKYREQLLPDFILQHWTDAAIYSLWSHEPLTRARKLLPSTLFENYYKFGFVRNPWDRELSHYHFILNWHDHRFHHQVAALEDFNDYVSWLIDHQDQFYSPQSRYLADDQGNVLADYVGRFEHLSEDVYAICEAIGIDKPVIPHANKTDHSHYLEYYNDRSIDLISQLYADDIRIFRYTVDNSSPD